MLSDVLKGQYMKNNLTKEFAEWLKQYSNVELMRSYDFAEHEINVMLKNEAPGEVISDDNDTFIAVYDYEFLIPPQHSTDNKLHRFCFAVKVIGIKSNVTSNDYEIEDYTEIEFMIK